jgi:hypothetical protein
MGRGEELIDEGLEGPLLSISLSLCLSFLARRRDGERERRRAGSEECLDLLRRRRQAYKIEIDAADQRPLVGRRGRGEALGLQLIQNEGVNRIADCGLQIADCRHFGARDRLPAPVLGFALGEVEGAGCRARSRGLFLGPGRAKLDPLCQNGDLFSRQLRLGRHLVQVAIIDRIDEEAVFGLARNDSRAGVATLFERGEAIDPQPSFGLVGLAAMALVAAGHEDRSDRFFEEFEACLVGPGRGSLKGDRQCSQERNKA